MIQIEIFTDRFKVIYLSSTNTCFPRVGPDLKVLQGAIAMQN